MSTPILSARSMSSRLHARCKPRHLLIASTSSVYGANATIPFRETDRADQPLTLYAATKKAARSHGAFAGASLSRSRRRCSDSSRSMGHGGGPTWPISNSCAPCCATSRSTSTGMGRCRAISPISTISIEAIVRLIACVPEIGARARRRVRFDFAGGAASDRQYRRRAAGGAS